MGRTGAGRETMTKTIKSAGYMVTDTQKTAIYGVGETVDEAWAQVVAEADDETFEDQDGNAISQDVIFEKSYRAQAASAALIAKVNAEGGDLAWGEVGGVACTTGEENAAWGIEA